MAPQTLLSLVIGVAILAVLVVLRHQRPTKTQGLWIGGGVVLGFFIMLGSTIAWGYRWGGYGAGVSFVFLLGGAFVGWAVTKLFGIK
jgi:hypothetical protein